MYKQDELIYIYIYKYFNLYINKDIYTHTPKTHPNPHHLLEVGKT